MPAPPYLVSFTDTDAAALSNTVLQFIAFDLRKPPTFPDTTQLYGQTLSVSAIPMPNRVRYTVAYEVSYEDTFQPVLLGTFAPIAGQPYIIEGDDVGAVQDEVNLRCATGEWFLFSFGGFDRNGSPHYYAVVISDTSSGASSVVLGAARSVAERDDTLNVLYPSISSTQVPPPFHSGARWFFPYVAITGGFLHI